MTTYKVEFMVCGYHVYHDIWEATVGQTPLCQWETGNSHYPYVVSVMEGSTVVGHLPRAISALCSLLLSRNGTISWKVTSTRRKSSDLPQGGLEIPCKLMLAGASRDISKVQKLITVAQSSGLGMTFKKDDDAEPEKKEGKRSRKEQPEKKQAEIDVPNFSEVRWLQLNDNCLSQVNKRELCDGKRLSEFHINYAQALLQKQFPELGGLHCFLL